MNKVIMTSQKVKVIMISKKVTMISKKVKVLITSQPLRGTENTRSPPLLAASALCNSKSSDGLPF